MFLGAGVRQLGGTVGDIESMPFVEAFRQFQFKVGKENIMFLHVSLVPATASDKEQKTKPTRHSVRELRGLGLSPDMIVCRSQTPLNESVKQKISNFCHVAAESVISVHDCASIYRNEAAVGAALHAALASGRVARRAHEMRGDTGRYGERSRI